MKRSFILLSLFILGSCFGTKWPEPSPREAQLIVSLEVRAHAKAPLPKNQGAYEHNPEDSWQFDRINYRYLKDIVVVLEGEHSTPGDLLPMTTQMVVGTHTSNRQMILLPVRGQLEIVNRHDEDLTFSYLSQQKGIEKVVVSDGTEVFQFDQAGNYHLVCDEHEHLSVEVYVIDHRWASMGESREDVFFNGMSPGDYQLIIRAPRLPEKRLPIHLIAGQRKEISISLGVQDLETP